MDSSIRIVHEATPQEPFFVIDKARGIPSAPLHEGEESAFTRLARLYPELYDVSGKKNVEHGLVHRLDTATRGLLLIAATQRFYDFITFQQRQGTFEKTYSADCRILSESYSSESGFPPAPLPLAHVLQEQTCIVQSRFRPYGRNGAAVRPVTAIAGKAAQKKAGSAIYRTQIHIIRQQHDTCHVHCSLVQGYRHQVRVHLAWLGLPVKGDKLYDPQHDDGDELAFTAFALRFPSEERGRIFSFSLEE